MQFDLNGKNLTIVRESNLELIIRLLIEQPVTSRAALAQKTGLKRATITYIINQLMEWGVVIESGRLENPLGRKGIAIQLNPHKYRAVGVKIGRDSTDIGLFDLRGHQLDGICINLPKTSKKYDLSDALEKGLDLIISKHCHSGILGIGIALPGIYDPNQNIINVFDPVKLVPEDLIERLESRFELPVYTENDANCGVLSSYRYKKQDGSANMVYISADGGIGAGIMINGELYRGSRGNAGELGHTSIQMNGPLCACGNRGCLEMYASFAAYLRRLNDESGRNYTNDEAIDAIKSGDPLAQHIFDQVCDCLALGLTNLINFFDPETVIISGKMSAGGEFCLARLSDSLARTLGEQRTSFIQLKLGDPAESDVLCGAAALVSDKLFKTPTKTFGAL